MSKSLQLLSAATDHAHAAVLQLHPAVLAVNAVSYNTPTLILAAAKPAPAGAGAGDIPTITSTQPPGGASLLTIGGWIGWGAFASCLVGVFIIVIKMGINAHSDRGEGGGQAAGKLFWPLLGCIITGSAGAILGAVA